ncbi:hypothetical protein [Rhizobium sp. BR 314]|uniref:hypothetical protein n=1 Tax=Rhizobium sp. BR 314 TaxID=3040013 RepID=UPI0039BFC0ED
MLLATAIAAALTSSFANAQQTPNNDRCKATDTTQQSEGKQTGNGQASPAPDSNPSKKLSDCDGVLKPPAIGDSQMEKPAPDVGNTLIIKPDDRQNGKNGSKYSQQPSK